MKDSFNLTVPDWFNLRFPDDDSCLEFLFNMRFPNQKFCRKCNSEAIFYRISTRLAYSCGKGHQFFPCSGGPFNKSTMSLRKWFFTLLCLHKYGSGLPASEIKRNIKVSYKTAWRIKKILLDLLKDENWKPLLSVLDESSLIEGRQEIKDFIRRQQSVNGKIGAYVWMERNKLFKNQYESQERTNLGR